MNLFPHPLTKRSAIKAFVRRSEARQTLLRDILWNQPVFKAPALPIPNVALEPLPLPATRITRRPASA